MFQDKLLTIGIVLALIVITFFLLIFMPTPACFFHTNDICQELLFLNTEDNFIELQEELSSHMTNRKELTIYTDNQLKTNISKIPITYELLRTLPSIKNALIITIDGKTEFTKMQGDACISNHFLRAVLPIKISGAKKSGIWVDGATKFFSVNEWVVYDNSRERFLFNKHKKNKTLLLILDIERPANIPFGISNENVGLLY